MHSLTHLTHECRGAIEEQFYAELLRLLKSSVPNVPPGCPPHPTPAGQHDRAGWPALESYFKHVFAQRTRAEWTATFIETDACTVPVLDRDEAMIGEAGVAGSRSFVLPALEGAARREMVQDGTEPVPPGVAPRLSHTPARVPEGSAQAYADRGDEAESAQLMLTPGEHSIEVLQQWIGAKDDEIKKLYQERVIGATDVPDDWEARSSKL